MALRYLGWCPDTPDPRDYSSSALRSPASRRLPRAVDLRPLCSAVEDQGALGSCVAHAVTGGAELLHRAAGRRPKPLSRLWLYYEARKREGTLASDAGAEIRSAIKALAKTGCAPESTWPYRTKAFRQKPPAASYQAAGDYQLLRYARLRTVPDVLRALASGCPVAFGFVVADAHHAPEVVRGGVLPKWGKSFEPEGGHAVLAVGYGRPGGHSGSPTHVLFRNSWGRGWGLGGYAWLPLSYLEDSDMADDLWALEAAEVGAKPLPRRDSTVTRVGRRRARVI